MLIPNQSNTIIPYAIDDITTVISCPIVNNE